MNKKAFIGATLVTATAVGGVVYFRHKILEQVDKWLDDGNEKPTNVWREAEDLSDEDVQRFEEALKKAEGLGRRETPDVAP